MPKQILILAMEKGTTFEASGDAFSLIDVPEAVTQEQLIEVLGDMTVDAEATLRNL